MNDLRTTDSVLEAILRAVETKESWDPTTWLEAATSLNALMGVEQAQMHQRQQALAQKKAELISAGETVASAKAKVEASLEYWESVAIKAKLDRIIETIRLAKLHARLAQAEWQSGKL